jgi:hypothetical protein
LQFFVLYNNKNMILRKFIFAVTTLASSLIAPITATATELNLKSVDQYSSTEQVTSITQFSDVRPTDWAYQALENLVQRYGCVAGYPNGTFKGGQAMTPV